MVIRAFLLLLTASWVSVGSAQELDVRTSRELAQAQRLLDAGRVARARNVLKRSLRRAPTLDAARLAVRLLPGLSDATEASPRAQRDTVWILEALQPLSGAEAERLRGWTLAVAGQSEDAIQAVSVRAQDADSATLLQEMAALFVARDALEHAERAMRRALRILPQSRELQLGFATLQMARGRPEHAVRALLSVLGLDPHDHVARRDLAGAFMAAGRHEEAMTTLRHLTRESDQPRDELLFADAALELGRHRVAEEAARRAIDAGESTGYSTLALALAAQGRRSEAMRALGDAPDDPRARRARRVLGASVEDESAQ